MAKSIKKNYLYNIIYQVIQLITPLVVTPYLSRVLGAEGIGKVSYAESIVSYFTLFAILGISLFGQREISYAQDSVEKRTVTFWNIKSLEFITSFTAIAFYIVFALLQKDNLIYFVFIFNIVAVFFDITWFFQGMEEFGIIVLRNIIIKFLSISFIFLFVKNSSDFITYAFGLSFFQFLANISLWTYLPKYITKIKIKYIRPFSVLNTAWSFFIPTLAIQLYTVLDKTMIGLITEDSFENGYYEVSMKLSKMTLIVVTSLGTVLLPRIGYYFENKRIDELKELLLNAYRFIWMMGIPMCLGLITISSNLVVWYLGVEFYNAIILLQILSFLIPVIGLSNVTGILYLVPTKKQNLLTLSVTYGAISNFILNIFLIYFYKSVGAAVASVIAEIIVTSVQLYFVRNELNIIKIFSVCKNYLLAGFVMFISTYYLSIYLSPSVLNTFILILTGFAVYSLMLIITKEYYVMILFNRFK